MKKAVDVLPVLPMFRVLPGSKPRTSRFIEQTAPNWWQLPKDLRASILQSPEATEFLSSLDGVTGFSECLGKFIQVLDRATRYESAEDIAREILTSYLFAAGAARWNRSAFDRVWADCVRYFDLTEIEMKYTLYAPIWWMPGTSRRLDLGGRLEILRLSGAKRAKIAALDTNVVGKSPHNRLHGWPVYFLVRGYEFDKKIVDGHLSVVAGSFLSQNFESLINEEVALLRALLGPEIAIPAYAVIREGYPRDPLTRSPVDGLRWRPRRWPPEARTRGEVASYVRRRAKFLNLKSDGWSDVFASMRRYAIAWENQFPADILADLVAALEMLLVRNDPKKVSRKLRARAAHWLKRPGLDGRLIAKDVNDAYGYRSRVAHGQFVFDDLAEWDWATRLGRAKRKHGNPFHHVNEIHRLRFTISDYYRWALNKMIDKGELSPHWTAHGL